MYEVCIIQKDAFCFILDTSHIIVMKEVIDRNTDPVNKLLLFQSPKET